ALITHCRTVSEHLPVVGFYLQPSVGGRPLSYAFWRRFAELPNVVAIKIAPFNRYQTIDVVRAVIDAGRDDIVLYTGNDDHIVDAASHWPPRGLGPRLARRARPARWAGWGGGGVASRGGGGRAAQARLVRPAPPAADKEAPPPGAFFWGANQEPPPPPLLPVS